MIGRRAYAGQPMRPVAAKAMQNAVRTWLLRAAASAAIPTAKMMAVPFAGGHRLATPYGVFVTPNITPDEETGIGQWTDAEFLAALREGRAPDGSAYYPSFPYPSYAGMTEQDALDIKAWLDTLEPVRQPNNAHELAWYVPGRWAMRIWQQLFSPWQYAESASTDTELQRGAYLVRHLGHCGECHTPRNIFGALDTARELAGSGSNDKDGWRESRWQHRPEYSR